MVDHPCMPLTNPTHFWRPLHPFGSFSTTKPLSHRGTPTNVSLAVILLCEYHGSPFQFATLTIVKGRFRPFLFAGYSNVSDMLLGCPKNNWFFPFYLGLIVSVNLGFVLARFVTVAVLAGFQPSLVIPTSPCEIRAKSHCPLLSPGSHRRLGFCDGSRFLFSFLVTWVLISDYLHIFWFLLWDCLWWI